MESDLETEPRYREIIDSFASYRECAQNFDGVTRAAVKGWAFRNVIPEKHWERLECYCQESGMPYTREDFRAWSKKTGQKISFQKFNEIAQIDWCAMKQSIVKIAWKKKWSRNDLELQDGSTEAVLSMMNHGVTSLNYGLRCFRNWLLTERQRSGRFVDLPDDWSSYSASIASPATQERRVFLKECMAASEALPRRMKGVIHLMAAEASDDEIADYLNVNVGSVRSYKSEARRTLREIMEVEKGEAA